MLIPTNTKTIFGCETPMSISRDTEMSSYTASVAKGATKADPDRRQGLVAAGGVLGALAASSCCILPLALSNVLIGHFIARGQFRVTSILVVVAVAYLFTLIETVAPVTIPVDTLDEGAYLMPKFKQVVKTLGLFNLILLAVAATAYLVTRERDPAKSAV